MADKPDQSDTKPGLLPNLSRRKFLAGAGLAGAGAVIADKIYSEVKSESSSSAVEANGTPAGAIPITLQVNGQNRTITVEPRTTLLCALRDHAEPPVTGPKLVCDQGTCGACTVVLDDKAVYGCLVLAVDAVGKKITTVEGLGTPESMSPLQASFVEQDALMCGFCTPGFITTISTYLKQNPNPTIEQIREACKGNFCRCGTYPRVFEAALSSVKGQRRAASDLFAKFGEEA
ncbi:MAG TPA: (2Fe-2S)-binding protein [Acidobacteriota bacterium]|nr:(2Fe-2S)-binding protein [Acidobacteriota bacterium]HND18762.1 (2Fe-2S)-binding protein [Acidobacteriota bacterium]